jgi:hypothetical protein
MPCLPHDFLARQKMCAPVSVPDELIGAKGASLVGDLSRLRIGKLEVGAGDFPGTTSGRLIHQHNFGSKRSHHRRALS